MLSAESGVTDPRDPSGSSRPPTPMALARRPEMAVDRMSAISDDALLTILRHVQPKVLGLLAQVSRRLMDDGRHAHGQRLGPGTG